jgi:S-adenosylmethionine synthetase
MDSRYNIRCHVQVWAYVAGKLEPCSFHIEVAGTGKAAGRHFPLHIYL